MEKYQWNLKISKRNTERIEKFGIAFIEILLGMLIGFVLIALYFSY